MAARRVTEKAVSTMCTIDASQASILFAVLSHGHRLRYTLDAQHRSLLRDHGAASKQVNLMGIPDTI